MASIFDDDDSEATNNTQMADATAMSAAGGSREVEMDDIQAESGDGNQLKRALVAPPSDNDFRFAAKRYVSQNPKTVVVWIVLFLLIIVLTARGGGCPAPGVVLPPPPPRSMGAASCPTCKKCAAAPAVPTTVEGTVVKPSGTAPVQCTVTPPGGDGVPIKTWCKDGFVAILSSQLSGKKGRPILPNGEFDGKAVAGMPGAADFKIGATADQMQAIWGKSNATIRVTTSTPAGVTTHAQDIGKVDRLGGFGNTCTACNCKGNPISDELYWFGGRGGCYGSAHFGVADTSSTHANCTSGPQHYGHFHRAHVNKGVYMFGHSCINEAVKAERFTFWLSQPVTSRPCTLQMPKNGITVKTWCRGEWALMLSSQLAPASDKTIKSSTDLQHSGEFDGETFGTPNPGTADFKLGLSGIQMQEMWADGADMRVTTTTASGAFAHNTTFANINNLAGFAGTCTKCNCKGNKISSDGFYWFGGRGACYGSAHFGVADTNSVHAHCNGTTNHYGHFHRPRVDKGIYMFGSQCINENEGQERFSFWLKVPRPRTAIGMLEGITTKLDSIQHWQKAQRDDLKGDFVLMGCFQDKRDRMITDGKSVRVGKGEDIVKLCVNKCKGMAFMGIQDGDECWCGDKYKTDSKYTKLPMAKCNAKCPLKNGCGGGWRVTLYGASGALASTLVSIPTTLNRLNKKLGKITDFVSEDNGPGSKYKFMGCYKDDKDRMMEDCEADANCDSTATLEHSRVSRNNGTITRCIAKCHKLGTFYMGIQHGDECWCGNRYVTDSKYTRLNDANCTTKDFTCPTAPANNVTGVYGCGGPWKMSLYEVPQANVSLQGRLDVLETQLHSILALVKGLKANNKTTTN